MFIKEAWSIRVLIIAIVSSHHVSFTSFQIKSIVTTMIRPSLAIDMH
jgi:hypothetical protein